MLAEIAGIIEWCLKICTSGHALTGWETKVVATFISTYDIPSAVLIINRIRTPQLCIRIWSTSKIISTLSLGIVQVTRVRDIECEHRISSKALAPIPETEVLINLDICIDLVACLVSVTTTDKVCIRVTLVTVGILTWNRAIWHHERKEYRIDRHRSLIKSCSRLLRIVTGWKVTVESEIDISSLSRTEVDVRSIVISVESHVCIVILHLSITSKTPFVIIG